LGCSGAAHLKRKITPGPLDDRNSCSVAQASRTRGASAVGLLVKLPVSATRPAPSRLLVWNGCEHLAVDLRLRRLDAWNRSEGEEISHDGRTPASSEAVVDGDIVPHAGSGGPIAANRETAGPAQPAAWWGWDHWLRRYGLWSTGAWAHDCPLPAGWLDALPSVRTAAPGRSPWLRMDAQAASALFA
jgi:hypothetical protein